MPLLMVLFEHAAGYGLFTVKEFEEIGMLLPQVEASVTDLKKFNQIVQLTAFSPFKSAVAALDAVNSISEGVVPDDLQMFLERSLPAKKKKLTLGVGDVKLAAAITETLGVSCLCAEPIPEIVRGIRMHFTKMVKGFTSISGSVAQLGLGHSYSRAKVKFNVNKVDNMIIQSIALLDLLDKDINTFSMRIREWYSYHFPELYKIIPENYLYAKAVKFIANRKELSEEKLDELEEIVMDRNKAEAILDASRSSMGMEIAPVDLANIEMFSSRVIELVEYRLELSNYLANKMGTIAPNLKEIVGDQVGARLISKAGSLTNLAKFPASTVQILGAEKALFRALKTRGKTPKYGLLYHSSYIAKAGPTCRGKISRFLANKCSLASRIDCFTDIATNAFGLQLKQQVEDRIKYYQTGEVPKKNIDVMHEANVENQQKLAKLEKKKKKEKRKSKRESEPDSIGDVPVNGLDETIGPNDLLGIEGTEEGDAVEEPPKKKKKKKKKKTLEQE